MPGSPATSPNFSAPRYSDADTADFASQVNGVTDAFDANVQTALNAKAIKWTYKVGSGVQSAVNGDFWIAGAGATINLPTPTVGAMIGIQADGATGASPVTVSCPVGVWIKGKGTLSSGGASSLPLGLDQSFMTLFGDGTYWRIIGGEQDSGWVDLTLIGSITNTAGGASPNRAAARVHGDEFCLSGILYNGYASALPSGSQIAQIPAAVRPLSAIVYMAAGTDATNNISIWINQFSDGHIMVMQSWPAGDHLGLDGIRIPYRM